MINPTLEETGETLSRRLRAETQTLHREAERTGIMVPLLRGRLHPDDYVRLLQSLLVVYETLEEGLEEHADHPVLQPLRMPELYRSAALRQDIEALGGDPGAPPLPDATVRYRERLQALSRESPHLLGAHAWVRYMGDLSGGRMVGVVVARLLGQEGPGAPGTRFYDFPREVDPVVWKGLFRNALDAMPLDPEQSRALVDEAIDAFRLHVDLFSELDEAAVSPVSPGPPPPPETPRSGG